MVGACLATLRALGPTVEVTYSSSPSTAGKQGHDGDLVLRSSRTSRAGGRFAVEIKRSHLSYALVAGAIAEARHRGDLLMFAPYVPPKLGGHLADHGVSYADAAGNCHILVRQELFAHVEGRRPQAASSVKAGGRVQSYQLMFAILGRPSLLEAPIRLLAQAADIGKSAAAEHLLRFEEQGLLGRTRAGLRLERRRELLDRWLAAYPDVVRPRWQLGRFRTQMNDPEALEARLREVMPSEGWSLGGGAAAWHMTHYYRGLDTVVHVREPAADLPVRLRAIPAADGPLTILRTPGLVPYEGPEPNLAHPLLVYTEMSTSMDPRMRESAEAVWKQFLQERP